MTKALTKAMSDSDISDLSDDGAVVKKVENLTSPPPPLGSSATLYGAPQTTQRSECKMKEVNRGDCGDRNRGEGIGHGDGRLLTWWRLLGLFVLLALATRFYYIGTPYRVVWDESHFGKMVSWYINRTLYFDVHPVGGKLLLTLFGYLGGYNGTHSFKEPSVPYDNYTGILPIRMGCALLGTALVPLSFSTVWQLTHSLSAASTAAALLTFEIGTITLTKFILLDPPLFLFIMASFHGLVLFHNQQRRPFTLKWWLAITNCGAMLGCVMSVKFVGLFVVLVVGIYTIHDLFTKFGQLNISLLVFLYHLLARVLCLILVPTTIYMAIFAIHEKILYKSKDSFAADDSNWSVGFQMQIEGNPIYNVKQPKELAYGSVVTLRNADLCGVYLHSHAPMYPNTSTAADLQQVTGLRGKDENNLFRILYPEDDPELEGDFYHGTPEVVTHGDWVRLYHLGTSALVSCTQSPALVTKRHHLVYAQSYNLSKVNTSSNNVPTNNIRIQPSPRSLFEVQIDGGVPGQVVNTLDTHIKFLSVTLKCALDWTRRSLPTTWGYGQGEITCSPNLQEPHTSWIIEQHFNPYLPNATFKHLEAGFWSRFVETHQLMAWVNSQLKPKGEDILTQHRPWMWPLLLKSQPWFDVNYRIVLLGNPAIFWINSFFVVVALTILFTSAYRIQRATATKGEITVRHKNGSFSETSSANGRGGTPEGVDTVTRSDARLVVAVRWLLLAYTLHYVPFYFMHRILYFHHYFPALHFSSMLTAVLFGYFVDVWIPQRLSTQRAAIVIPGVISAFYGVVVLSFLVYCHVGYGYTTEGNYDPDNSTYRHVRIFDAWEI